MNQSTKKLLNRLFGIVFPLLLTLPLLFCSQPGGISEPRYAEIQDGFIIPRNENKPWCYYYWIGDDISKEGVTADLEAMKEFGLGAVLIGNINPDGVDGKVPLFSDEWWDITTHVVNEGHRLGIDIGFFNCPGWSQSGGPWVSYDKAMRHIVYSEATITGPGEQTVQLEKPAEEFQDTYVLAFRKIAAENNVLAKETSLFKITGKDEYTIDIKGKEAILARSLVLKPGHTDFICDAELQAQSGRSYQSVKTFHIDRSKNDVNVGPATYAPIAIDIPPTSASSFRLVCKNFRTRFPEAGFSEVIIGENPVLEKYVDKSLGKLHPTPQPEFDSYIWASQPEVEDESMKITEQMDLSKNMDENGVLTWKVPEGEWTVLRMGMTPTGTMNSPSAPQGKGYEIDKASTELVRFHFDNFIAEILKRIPEESKPAFKYVIADSYEMGSQNWTDGFTERFEKKFGYNPVKYLPTLSGRIVSSVAESDRFLWDLRRAVADDIAYKYVGGLKQVSNEHNLKLWLEPYGHWGFPSEFLMYGGQSDLVGGEYWNEGTLGNIECKSASSVAHMYGKPVTSAEAFTAGRKTYMRHPAVLKARGDWSFTEGINHLVLHLYIQQPDDDRVPGVNAWFSTEFNRHNTWFKQGKHWVDYLRRCQHMLQQGNYAADVLYYIGEDAPKMTGIVDPPLPPGYSYDYINAEVILERLSVEDGAFVLPDGVKYRLLVLPEGATIRPEALAKLAELVKQGGTILGSRFTASPSLQNYPECDLEIQRLSSELWGETQGMDILTRPVGKGHVMDDMGVKDALDFLGVQPDVEAESDVPFLWTHRSMQGMEIYFLTNQSEKQISFKPSFRVSGLQPQLWDAVTGEIRSLPEYSDNGERTSVPVKLTGYQSVFIVFTNRSNENTGDAYAENFPELEAVTTIDGNWTLEFKNKDIGPAETITMGELSDWTASEDEAIRYYSGTVAYTTTFNLEAIPDGDLFINLGKVGVMAEVKINGEDLGGTWISPFRLNTKGSLKAGENTLEIEVVNVWRNRLIKDKMLPEDQRKTWHIVDDIEPGEELMPSGLLGPVTLESLTH